MTEVTIAGLRKQYAGVPALSGVDLSASSGELVTLLGPSGCGKTTTLRCIAGFLEPDSGDIRVDGVSIRGTPLRKRDFGVVFQNYALFPHMTVRDNVAYGLRVRRTGREETARRVAEALGTVGLEGMAERLPRTLSGGQQQRVALARALVIRPRLLLLDEPLANLDAKLRQDMRKLIRTVQQSRGITAFYVTHDQAEAMAISDRVAVMERGRVAQFAEPRTIYQRPASRYVAAFTGEASVVPARVLRPAGPGRYLVALGAGEPLGGIEVSGPDGLGGDAAVDLMLRPETVSRAADGVPAVVQSCTFVGAAQQCEVLVDSAVVLMTIEAQRRVTPGEALHLRLDPGQAWLMPRTAA